MPHSKFDELCAKVAKMNITHGSLAGALDDVLDRARINADDTCYLEKAAPASQTVSDILSQSGTDSDVVAWFVLQGVKF